jgi:hypothetical protein
VHPNQVLSQEGPAQDALREAFTRARQVAEDATLDLATSGITPRSFGQELLQLAAEGFEVVEQVPGLLTDIAEDRKEFFPSGDTCINHPSQSIRISSLSLHR